MVIRLLSAEDFACFAHHCPSLNQPTATPVQALKDGLQQAKNGAETRLNSSLIASWRSDAEQTQAQSGAEPS